MTTPLYFDNFCLRFNSNLQALEYNSGNEVWLSVPVPTGDIGLPSGDILVGNASNLASPVTMSGGATINGSGVVTLTSTSVTGALLTGYTSGAGTVAATDTILQAINKLNGNAAAKLSSALTTLHTFAGVGGVATDTSVVEVDVAHNSVGINHAPDTTGTWDLQVNGSILSRNDVIGAGLQVLDNGIIGADNAAHVVFQNVYDDARGWVLKNGSAADMMIWDTLHNQIDFAGAPKFPTGTVTGTGTITPNAYAQSTLIVNVTGDTTINGPTNGYDGQKLTFRIVNDGSHSVALATGSGNFGYGTTITGYTNSASTVDYIGVIYDLAKTQWDVVSLSQGF